MYCIHAGDLSQKSFASWAGHDIYLLLSNCVSYCTKSARNEYKHSTILYSWLLYLLLIVREPCARSSAHYTCSFLSSYWKRLKKIKFDNKPLIRYFGVNYRRIFLLDVFILTSPAGSSKYSTSIERYSRDQFRSQLLCVHSNQPVGTEGIIIL